MTILITVLVAIVVVKTIATMHMFMIAMTVISTGISNVSMNIFTSIKIISMSIFFVTEAISLKSESCC